MIFYSQTEFETDIEELAVQIDRSAIDYDSIYPVPRGGIPVAIALASKLFLPLVSDPGPDTLIVDDLIDSGATRARYWSYDFACLHIKSHTPKEHYPKYYVSEKDGWVEYWWEKMAGEQPAEDAVIRLIESVGENPTREGLKETPTRFIKAWQELFSGYATNAKDIIKTFDSDGYDQMVLLKDIELYSMCEHHLMPFFGKAHVAYIPNKRVIGISKLARLVDIYSKRMQIQERLAEQVAKDLMDHLNPIGAACIIEAEHLCMRMRGVQKQNSVMTTSSLKGVFLENSEKGLAARNELMRLIK